jgi:C4-dicarboxylate transporter DctQ subunit
MGWRVPGARESAASLRAAGAFFAAAAVLCGYELVRRHALHDHTGWASAAALPLAALALVAGFVLVLDHFGLLPSAAVNRTTIAVGETVSFFFLIAVATTAYEVLVRYALDAPTTWAFEVSIGLCAAAFSFGGAYTLRRDGHIRITTFYDMAPRRAQFVLDVINSLIMLAYLMAIGYGALLRAGRSLSEHETTGTASNLPLPQIEKVVLVVAIVLMFVQGLVQLAACMRRGNQASRNS